MNIRFFLTMLMGLTALMTPVNISAEETVSRPYEGIQVGERLVYKITWLGIPVGVGEMWAKEKMTLNGREVFHIVGTIETNKVLSRILPMHDEAHSWIDAKTLEAVQFEKKVDELLLKAHEMMRFDAAKKKGYFESFKTGEKKEFDITPPVQDVISVTYWVRRQVLAVGESVKTSLIVDRKKWDLEIYVARKETVKIQGRKVNTIRVEPTTWEGGYERRGKAVFYVGDDPARIPVKITYKAHFGRVSGTLQKIESEEGLSWKQLHQHQKSG